MKMSITRAADILLRGGVIAYPTEGVFGLGCMPDNAAALDRLLTIKQRDSSKGLILLAADAAQLDRWIWLSDSLQIPEPDPTCPITWIAPAASGVSEAIRGNHAGIAVRITTNPTAAAICNAVDSPITSTSANLSGEATTRNRIPLRRKFEGLVDYIVPGDCGPANGPSEIRDLITGHTIRPRET
jgi:L-threonylcarbamoyladenylate synthase